MKNYQEKQTKSDALFSPFCLYLFVVFYLNKMQKQFFLIKFNEK